MIEKEKFKEEVEARRKKFKEEREKEKKLLNIIERVIVEGETDELYEEFKKETTKLFND